MKAPMWLVPSIQVPLNFSPGLPVHCSLLCLVIAVKDLACRWRSRVLLSAPASTPPLSTWQRRQMAPRGRNSDGRDHISPPCMPCLGCSFHALFIGLLSGLSSSIPAANGCGIEAAAASLSSPAVLAHLLDLSYLLTERSRQCLMHQPCCHRRQTCQMTWRRRRAPGLMCCRCIHGAALTRERCQPYPAHQPWSFGPSKQHPPPQQQGACTTCHMREAAHLLLALAIGGAFETI